MSSRKFEPAPLKWSVLYIVLYIILYLERADHTIGAVSTLLILP